MAEKKLSPPRYWIFKDSSENHFLQESSPKSKRAPTKRKLWLIEPNSAVHPQDFVYFWREEDSSYFYGWGVIDSEPAPLEANIVGGSVKSSPEARFGVRVRYHLFESSPVMRAELRDDPALKSLSRLREIKRSIIELDGSQAAALNQLIRSRDIEAPPDPLSSEKPLDGVDAGGRQAEETNLSQLLERYSDRLTVLSRAILEQAAEFANKREQKRHRITTSCILFAAVELGRSSPGQEVETAAQFVFHWMTQTESRSVLYERAFSDFLGAADPDPTYVSATLTRNTTRLIETATWITNNVRKDVGSLKTGLIHARDLIGALLFTMAKKSKSGASSRLASMDVSLDSLRRDYFDNFINNEKNPDDDLEKWRRVLLELQLPVEDRPHRIPRETKPSLPSIDADSPSDKDHLNITPEVIGFANIIAARDVKTPLSIGLFGDWGSGKSTFMEQLQREVEAIAKGVREKKEGEETSFLGNIVQIKFNAWHYAEANLWASLVSHVFENLSFSEQEEKEKAEKRQQLFLGRLAASLTSQRVAEADVKAKEASYEEAKVALEGAKRAQDNARMEKLQWLTEGVWPLVLNLLNNNDEAQRTVSKARAILGREGLTEEELRRELEASKTTLGRAQLHVTSIINDPQRGLKIAIIVGLTFLLPLGFSFLVARLSGNQTLERVIAGVAPLVTLLGGAFAWLRSKHPTVQGWLDTISKAEQHLDKMYAAAKLKYRDELSRLSDVVIEKQGEINDAKQRVEAAKTEVAETIASLKEMEPGRVLERFVQERAASTDYRKLLGVIALIRRDFKKLSEMMLKQDNKDLREAVTEILKKDEEQRKLEAKSAIAESGIAPVATAGNNGHAEAVPEPDEKLVEETLKEYRIDRIVLYIDDLDRCPPKQVVDVLQAIHLLLAFELFVVVVGVDARWIRHALRKRFPEMLSEDWDEGDAPGNGERRLAKTATPRDYVEKIFQVPFWLKPMDDGSSRDLLRGLIPDNQLLRPRGGNEHAGSKTATKGTEGRQATGGIDSDNSGRTGTGNKTGGSTPPAEPGANSAGMGSKETEADNAALGTNVESPRKPAFVLKPENLLLDLEERNAMIALSRVIGRTPRTLKRFVNVYRIIKAGLNGKQFDSFMGSGPSDAQYRAVLVLLGVAHGAPDVAPAFFLELKEKHENTVANDEKDIGLKAFLKQMSTSPGGVDESLRHAWICLIGQLQTAFKDADDIALAVLREWLPVVVRYTFQLGRLSEEVATERTAAAAN